MRTALYILSALFIGFMLAFVSAWPESMEETAFHLGLVDTDAELDAIQEAIRSYNSISARFYATGGEPEGLGYIQAAPLVKRRLFKDISMLKGDGLVMVFDLDRILFYEVKLHKRIEAEAITDEVWAIALQDADTRAPLFNVKAIEIRARYLLYKVPFAGGSEQWVVYDVDVYPKGTKVPQLEQGTSL